MDTEGTDKPAEDDVAHVEPGAGPVESGDALDVDLEQDGEGTGEQEADNPDPGDDLEEVERDGKKYRVSKALKDELMMRADHTRKTMELAEQRKALDAERTRQAESFEALRGDHIRVHTLESQLEAYRNVDWPAAMASDPDNARLALDQYRALQVSLEDAKSELSKKEAERLQSHRQTADKAMEETVRVLSRDIKGWNSQLAGELVKVAGEYGVSQEELISNPNPRDWKLLHDLYTLRQQVKKQTTTQRQQAATSVQPAATLGARKAPMPAGVHDDLPIDEWMRRERARAAKRA